MKQAAITVAVLARTVGETRSSEQLVPRHRVHRTRAGRRRPSVPCDCLFVLRSGSAVVNEASLTGESVRR